MPCQDKAKHITDTYSYDPTLLSLDIEYLKNFKENCKNEFDSLPEDIQIAINNRLLPPAPPAPATPVQKPAAQPPVPQPQPQPESEPTNPDKDIDFKLDMGPTYRDPSNNSSGPKRKF